MFTRANGEALSINSLSHAFRRIATNAGVDCRLHDLRHVAATIMIQANVNPKTISTMLALHSVALTLDTYGHLSPSMQEESAATLEPALGVANGS